MVNVADVCSDGSIRSVLLVGSLVMSTKISSDESTFSFVINGINNLF